MHVVVLGPVREPMCMHAMHVSNVAMDDKAKNLLPRQRAKIVKHNVEIIHFLCALLLLQSRHFKLLSFAVLLGCVSCCDLVDVILIVLEFCCQCASLISFSPVLPACLAWVVSFGWAVHCVASQHVISAFLWLRSG